MQNKVDITVLFSGGGGPGYPAFYKALRKSTKYHARIIAGELNPLAGNLYIDDWVDEVYRTPENTSPEFLETMLDIVDREKANFFLSAIDEELALVAQNQSRFQNHGCDTLLPPEDSLECAFDKGKTGNSLKGVAAMPATVQSSPTMDLERIFDELGGGVVVKACRARGNRDNFKAHDLEEFEFYVSRLRKTNTDFLCQSFIDGDEFNVSLMLNKDGEPLYSVCRQKIDPPRTRPNTMAGLINRDKEMETIAVEVCKHMGLFPGTNNVEFLRPGDGRPLIIDVNGGRHAAQDFNLVDCGINIPEMMIDVARGETVSSVSDDLIPDGLLCLKYIDEYTISMTEVEKRCRVPLEP